MYPCNVFVNDLPNYLIMIKKRLLMFSVILHFCMACGGGGEQPREEHHGYTTVYAEQVDPKYNNFVYTIEVDGCEYLVLAGYYPGGIIHKANCKNVGFHGTQR